MTVAPESELHIRYEGEGVAPELWGMTQANFSVSLPGRSAREFAVMVNDVAMDYLIEQLGGTDTPDYRRRIARAVGEVYVPVVLAKSRVLDPLITVSRATFAESAGLLAEVRAKVTAGAA